MSYRRDWAGELYGLPSSASLKVAGTSIDEDAVDRILTAVGKPFIPVDLNKDSLRTAINEAAEAKEIVDRYRSGPRTRRLIRAMGRISKAADSLARAIKENGDASQLIADAMPHISTIIPRLIEYTTWQEQRLIKSNAFVRARHGRIPSKRDWLAVVELPNIFEEFFNRKAGRSRSAGAPSGPTVRFIVAVMNEIDHPPNSETIVRAMTMYSELRKARAAVRNRAPSIGKK